MELLTRNNFEDWMQKLMERLDRQDELLLSLRPSIRNTNRSAGISTPTTMSLSCVTVTSTPDRT